MREIMGSVINYHMLTFVAGTALETGKPFPVECMPPFEDEYVLRPCCESTICMLVVEGDLEPHDRDLASRGIPPSEISRGSVHEKPGPSIGRTRPKNPD